MEPYDLTSTTSSIGYRSERKSLSAAIGLQLKLGKGKGKNKPLYGRFRIQDAYNAAASGDTIKVQATTLNENLTLTGNNAVSLQGGYDAFFMVNIGFLILVPQSDCCCRFYQLLDSFSFAILASAVRQAVRWAMRRHPR